MSPWPAAAEWWTESSDARPLAARVRCHAGSRAGRDITFREQMVPTREGCYAQQQACEQAPGRARGMGRNCSAPRSPLVWMSISVGETARKPRFFARLSAMSRGVIMVRMACWIAESLSRSGMLKPTAVEATVAAPADSSACGTMSGTDGRLKNRVASSSSAPAHVPRLPFACAAGGLLMARRRLRLGPAPTAAAPTAASTASCMAPLMRRVVEAGGVGCGVWFTLVRRARASLGGATERRLARRPPASRAAAAAATTVASPTARMLARRPGGGLLPGGTGANVDVMLPRRVMVSPGPIEWRSATTLTRRCSA